MQTGSIYAQNPTSGTTIWQKYFFSKPFVLWLCLLEYFYLSNIHYFYSKKTMEDIFQQYLKVSSIFNSFI